MCLLNAYNFGIAKRLATLFVLLSLSLTAHAGHIPEAQLRGYKHNCQRLLESLGKADAEEAVLGKIDEVDAYLESLQGVFPNTDFLNFRAKLSEITDQALQQRPYKETVVALDSLLKEILDLFPREHAQSQDSNLSVNDLIVDPQSIKADAIYQTAAPNLQVVFEDKVLRDIQKLPPETIVKLLKAVQKGFVGSHSGSGIYRATDVHKNFAEVKHVPGVVRLLSCLDGKVLKVRKLIEKQNEGKAGSLAKYDRLCVEDGN